MVITTLCYLEKDNKLLMLNRNKKAHDLNHGKWIGVGGKLELHESPDECIVREIKEETKCDVEKVKLVGIITFVLPKWEDELCFVYTCDTFTGEMQQSNEGYLAWIDKEKVFDLTLWEGDRYFLPKVINHEFFNIKLIYDDEDKLVAIKD